MDQSNATLDLTIPGHPRLVVELSPEQETVIQEALDALQEVGSGGVVQRIVADALQTAVEQRYYWSTEWQAAECEADTAIAEGRVKTFDTMEEMLEFLDAQ